MNAAMTKDNFSSAKPLVKGLGRSKSVQNKPVYDLIKRIIDVVCSLFGIILLSPIFITISIIIKATSKGPVFFVHKRVGKNGKEIGIYKFRSMVVNAEQLLDSLSEEQKEEFRKNFKLENDPRITKVGNILRKTSLDELPQLFNILKGDISIIGPRPVVEAEIKFYGNYKDLLLSVKPGLTGFWAANGRSDTSYTRRRAMEIYYVKNRSLLFDFKIFCQTFVSVFKGEGAK